ncbi:MAG: MFS transporter [Paracoccaceae bacterium]|nr:MFS transporter [Paracoccaceae bacterium]
MQDTDRRLSLGQKAGWGLADMGIVVFVIVKQLLVLSFLTNYLGVPVTIAGMVTTGILFFDMITDPLIGYLSDRTNTRWGRRAPWMFVGALVLAAGTVGLFGVPEKLDLTSTILWVSGFFILATIGFTMVAIPYGATAGEMTQNPQERSAMMGFRMAFASLGILLGGAVIPQLAGGTREGHLSAVIIVVPIMVLAIWGSIWSTRKTPRIMEPSRQNPWEMASLVWNNTSFMILVIIYGVMTLAIALITAGLPFAAMYLILDDGETMLSSVASGLGVLSLMFAAFVLGSILSQAVWVWLSTKLGKTLALIAGLVLYIIVLFVIYRALPSVNVTAIAGLFMLAGMTNGAYQQIPWAMYPDLMDITRAKTGAAIEGAFSAIWLFGQKFANALAPSLLAFILSIYGWRETTKGITEQLPEAINALRMSITIVPLVILAVAILGLIFVYLRSIAANDG